MNSFNPTDIESAFKAALASVFTGVKVYTSRPKAAVSASEFVVARLSSDITDLAAYGECYMEVSLFARDVDNVKNTAKLGVMFTKALSAIPAQIGRYIISREPKILADVPDDYGFTARILEYKVTIKNQ